jgi:hypothetical protein
MEETNISHIHSFTDFPTPPQEQYQLALESIFRWTLRRDELNDDQIVLAIKRVAKYALEDV